MREDILAWLAGRAPPPAAVQVRGLPAGTPPWLKPDTLPPVHLNGQPISWRRAFALLWTGDPRLLDLLSGAEALCTETVQRWLRSTARPDTFLGIAASTLPPAARVTCLITAVKGPLGTADALCAARLLAFLDVLDTPDVWGALAFLTLWPRRPVAAHHLQQALAARDAAGDWRALLLERVTRDLPEPTGLVGTTVRAAPGSREALHSALLEEAMCAEARWSPDAWADRIAPHVAARELLTVTDSDGRWGVLHPATLPAEAPVLDGAAEGEAFAQRSRPVVRLSSLEGSQYMVRRYRGLGRVPVLRIWTLMLQRGWMRGEVLDYPRVFEVYRPLYAWDLCAYVRVSPGMHPHQPDEDSLHSSHGHSDGQQIFGVAFQPGAHSRPPWGGACIQAWEMVEGTEPQRIQLGAVPVVALSEVLWPVAELFAASP